MCVCWCYFFTAIPFGAVRTRLRRVVSSAQPRGHVSGAGIRLFSVSSGTRESLLTWQFFHEVYSELLACEASVKEVSSRLYAG